MELDSDDEDALILAQQPFETVMQTGFKDYLNHLHTKFIARRSDIIVSSTLSITLTPMDDQFVPIHFASIGEDEIWDYVMKWQEYRAFGVNSNVLPKPGVIATMGFSDDSSVQSDDAFTKSAMDYSEFDADQKFDDGTEGNKSSNNNAPVVRLPATLASEPIDPKKVPFLSFKERRLYNLQKGKYEQQIKVNSKRPVHPRDQVHDLDDARSLIKGTYHIQDEEDEDVIPDVKLGALEGKTVLNRAMDNFKNAPQEEMKLDSFESNLIEKIQDLNFDVDGTDPRTNSDYVP